MKQADGDKFRTAIEHQINSLIQICFPADKNCAAISTNHTLSYLQFHGIKVSEQENNSTLM